MTKAEKARELFLSGYNCCQAVAGAFSEEMGMELDVVTKICSPFGGGFGRTREVCGTVSGMMFVLGALRGYNDPNAREEKSRVYREAQELINKFKEDNGSVICRELLGLQKGEDVSPVPLERTGRYYKKRPCAELCAYAAGLLEDKIGNN